MLVCERLLRCVAIDLPPTSRTRLKLVKSVNHQENDGHEEEQIHRSTVGASIEINKLYRAERLNRW